jgi:hypothetical protein
MQDIARVLSLKNAPDADDLVAIVDVERVGIQIGAPEQLHH